jgi:2-polyprenyl-3-methyl-5-hydroxy-6-metoxy-1,4-benzoquinol methylase
MKLTNINNPVFKDLVNLNLINTNNLKLFLNKTRDSDIKSYIDLDSKIIFLEKYDKNKKYYIKKKTNRKFFLKKSVSSLKFEDKKILIKNLDDDHRRFDQFKGLIKNKSILDFGCGKGRFIKMCQKISKKVYALEVNKSYIKELKKILTIKKDLKNFNKTKFDIITMFHVLEHLPNQIEVIKSLLQKLKKNGKLIIEVPSAHDPLFKVKGLVSFKNFTMWSEHLILHTSESLKKFCLNAGAKKIKIKYFQRYNFSNHYGWIVDNLPGGHEKYDFSSKINTVYQRNLEKKNETDTLIAVLQK